MDEHQAFLSEGVLDGTRAALTVDELPQSERCHEPDGEQRGSDFEERQAVHSDCLARSLLRERIVDFDGHSLVIELKTVVLDELAEAAGRSEEHTSELQ